MPSSSDGVNLFTQPLSSELSPATPCSRDPASVGRLCLQTALSPLPCGIFLFLQVLLAAVCLLHLFASDVLHALLGAVGLAGLLFEMGQVSGGAVVFVEDVVLIVAFAVAQFLVHLA